MFLLKKNWLKRGNGKSAKKTAVQIADKLNITLMQYMNARKDFNRYYKQFKILDIHHEQLKKHTHKRDIHDILHSKVRRDTSPNFKDGETKLDISDINLDVLESYVICGFTRERIASLLGITRTTLYWYAKQFPHIQDVLDNARDKATTKVVTSMLSMTQDRLVTDTAVSTYLGKISTKTIKRHAPGNANMIKYWMANNAGWSSEPRPEMQNNKGLILKMLESMTGDTNEDESSKSDASKDSDEEEAD
ncbi:MAG: hypothetical protein HC773_20415 [Scytonema sp. CRU_2_7]|nr:hypothetical protein [Scytonema sp. CRU_2_7]